MLTSTLHGIHSPVAVLLQMQRILPPRAPLRRVDQGLIGVYAEAIPPSDAESTASKQLAKYKSEKRDISEEVQPPRAPVRVDDAGTPRPAAHTYPLLAARSRAGK